MEFYFSQVLGTYGNFLKVYHAPGSKLNFVLDLLSSCPSFLPSVSCVLSLISGQWNYGFCLNFCVWKTEVNNY